MNPGAPAPKQTRPDQVISVEQRATFDQFLKEYSKPHPTLAVTIARNETAQEHYYRRKRGERKTKEIHPASVVLASSWIQLYTEYLDYVKSLNDASDSQEQPSKFFIVEQ